MTPYHYSIVRCRDAEVRGEHRNVGLLVVSPVERKAWLRRGRLAARAHLVGDDAAFVRALLDILEDEAKDLAREGEPARVHDWMRSRARLTEDAVSLSPPAVGVADDLTAEVTRLAEAYLGKAGGGGRTAAEKLQLAVLRRHGLQRRFEAREFPSGPAVWGFPHVVDLAGGPLVFNALQFAQKTAEGVIDAAWTNVGRKEEVSHFHPSTRWLTLALGPTGDATAAAFTRAIEVMADGGLNIVPPTESDITAALADFNLVPGQGIAEAK
jgi:hypothetical protein